MEEISIQQYHLFGNLRTPQFSIFGWPFEQTLNQSNRLHLQQNGGRSHTSLALNAILLVKNGFSLVSHPWENPSKIC